MERWGTGHLGEGQMVGQMARTDSGKREQGQVTDEGLGQNAGTEHWPEDWDRAWRWSIEKSTKTKCEDRSLGRSTRMEHRKETLGHALDKVQDGALEQALGQSTGPGTHQRGHHGLAAPIAASDPDISGVGGGSPGPGYRTIPAGPGPPRQGRTGAVSAGSA